MLLKRCSIVPLGLQLWRVLICPGHRLEAGEGQENLVKEILRKTSELLKAWESNAVAEVIHAACKAAPGFPGLEDAAAARNGVGCQQPCSSPQEPPTLPCPHLRCVLKVMMAWWLHLPEPTGKLVVPDIHSDITQLSVGP